MPQKLKKKKIKSPLNRKSLIAEDSFTAAQALACSFCLRDTTMDIDQTRLNEETVYHIVCTVCKQTRWMKRG